MAFVIEKNVPFTGLVRFTRYPFPEMEVGDSFECPASEAKRARAAAIGYGARHNMKFSARKQADGSYRLWRIA